MDVDRTYAAFRYAGALAAAGRHDEAERAVRAPLTGTESVRTPEPGPSWLYLSQAWRLLGIHLDETGRAREAMDAYERALEALPNSSTTVSLVLLLADTTDAAVRDTRRAVELARAALTAPPVDRRTLTAIAPAMQERQVMQPARAWNLLGCALICDGQWREGLDAAARSVELGYDEDGTDWVYEAIAHARLGHDGDARRLAELAEEWFAEHPDVAAAEERFARRRAEAAQLLRPPPPR